MRTTWAAAGSGAFFVLVPGSVVGLVPWALTGWRVDDSWPLWVRAFGAFPVLVGAVPLVHAFGQFVRAGGTPAPVAPTERLVVSGFNRWVRNPMYVGVVTMIVGQGLLLGRASLLVYALVVWVATASFVRWYEEPTLARAYGAEYAAYRAAVPAWWPRRRPWDPTGSVR
ncbi:methyltransferase family protein [Pseudonocardia humida]|uniref:Isoprenylcysteine carboxylmethyltransferase family protein n=1 Tax=Pseudonocardia humida TaxID=2800819 RepID=A0ABT1A547_9PSEU|nr:isoprenylcysteine carboxylmethyltransferase family protein [Pseudonocardia humida]MCO1658053.1 isoprenylcysteine carboxylmethyltransferase family protein [Pseudonocardia humida]